jgi:GDP-L-fucose synthase
MKETSKIYVAGHRGLAGSALLRKLQEKGFRNLCYRTSQQLDLRRQKETELVLEAERPEYLFLAAGKVGGILANATYKAEFIYDNLVMAANLIDTAYRIGVKKLLNLGSSCIYPKLASQPITEDQLLTGMLEPTNEAYAVAKIAAIKLCRYYNEQYGTQFISVMPNNLYGVNDNFNLETAHVFPALIRKFHLARLLREKRGDEIRQDLKRFSLGFHLGRGEHVDPEATLEKIGITAESVTLWGSGEVYREFLYVDDLAEACVFLMDRCDTREIGEFINIGTGQDNKLKDVAFLIQRLVGFEGRIVFDSSKPDGTPRKLLDISRIRGLGWEPRTTLEEGIRKTYAWYVESAQKG